MIITDQSRAKAAETRAATAAAKATERAAAEEAKAAELAAVKRRFGPRSAVIIDCPKDRARHGKQGKVVSINDTTRIIEIGVRIDVLNPRKPVDPDKYPGISAWYLPSELTPVHPKH